MLRDWDAVREHQASLADSSESGSEVRIRSGSRVQHEVTELVSVQDKQTVQGACHARLFEGCENPPKNVRGEPEWYELFDRVLRSVE